MYNSKNVDEATQAFTELLSTVIRHNTRLTKIKQNKKKPWITAGLINSTKIRDNLYKKWKKDKNNEILSTQFKNYRNLLNNLIKETKNKYYSNEIHKSKGDTKHLWKVINENRSKSNKSSTVINEIQHENKKIVGNVEIANVFVSYFTGVGKNLAQEITYPKNYKEKKKRIKNSMYCAFVTEDEIEKIILSLKNNKAPGIDEIEARTLKEIDCFNRRYLYKNITCFS